MYGKGHQWPPRTPLDSFSNVIRPRMEKKWLNPIKKLKILLDFTQFQLYFTQSLSLKSFFRGKSQKQQFWWVLQQKKFGTNNDAYSMKEDEEEDEEQDEEEDEDEDEEEDSLHSSQEPFRMITKLILAQFTV